VLPLSVRACVRPCVRPPVRYQNLVSAQYLWKDCIDSIQIWYVDIYNIKTQVKFDLDYNALIFDGVMGLL